MIVVVFLPQRASTSSRERAHSKCHHRSSSSARLAQARCIRSHRVANHGSHTVHSMPATSGIKKTHSQRELPVARAIASPSPTDYCCVFADYRTIAHSYSSTHSGATR